MCSAPIPNFPNTTRKPVTRLVTTPGEAQLFRDMAGHHVYVNLFNRSSVPFLRRFLACQAADPSITGVFVLPQTRRLAKLTRSFTDLGLPGPSYLSPRLNKLIPTRIYASGIVPPAPPTSSGGAAALVEGPIDICSSTTSKVKMTFTGHLAVNRTAPRVHIPVLMDTGASRCIISRDLVQDLGLPVQKVPGMSAWRTGLLPRSQVRALSL